MNHLLKLEVGTPLSQEELKRMIFRENVRFADYSEIPKNTTIKKLLPGNKFAGLVIFLEDAGHANKGVGHWVALFRHPRSGTHYFDSLGYGLRKDLKITGADDRLLHILARSPGVKQNTFVFQSRKQSVQDCARHVACRINFAQFTAAEYRSFMNWKGLNPDVLAVLLTLTQSRIKQHLTE